MKIKRIFFAACLFAVSLIFVSPCTAQEYSMRPLDELNHFNIGEAYPWLSADAQRLYFCGNNNNRGFTQLFVAHRDPTSGRFKAPQRLQINMEGYDNLCPYLSADEKTIVFVVRQPKGRQLTRIFIATRPNRYVEFSSAREIRLADELRGELLSPSLTADQSQLFLFNFYRGRQNIIRFDRQYDDSYQYKNRTVVDAPHILKTGRLSTDGLEYYLSIDRRFGRPSIYIMKRNELYSNFNEMEAYKDNYINDVDSRNHQPYFTPGKDHIVFTRSGRNLWDKNDMYIASRVGKMELTQDFKLQDILIYPNPAWHVLYFKSQDRDAELPVRFQIEIYDLASRLVLNHRDLTTDDVLDLYHLPASLYIVHIVDPVSRERKVFKLEKINH